MSAWEDLVCLTAGLSAPLYANKKLLRARQHIFWDAQMFCKRLRCWVRQGTETPVCSKIQNRNRGLRWSQVWLSAIYDRRVCIVIVQYIPPWNISLATNDSILTALLWNHLSSVSLFGCGIMVLHKHVHALSHQSVSSCVCGSACFFMQILPHPACMHPL